MTQLPPDLTEEWNQWCSELPRLHLVAIPRWYHIEIQPDMQSVQLHVYCDASEMAYSAVAYMQGKDQDGEILTSFVASKSRVAPLKKLILPMLRVDLSVDWSKAGKQSTEIPEYGKESTQNVDTLNDNLALDL